MSSVFTIKVFILKLLSIALCSSIFFFFHLMFFNLENSSNFFGLNEIISTCLYKFFELAFKKYHFLSY